MITWLLAKAQGWAVTALGVLAVLVGAYSYGYRKARKATILEQNSRLLEQANDTTIELESAVKDRNEISQAVNDMSPDDAARELRNEWTKD